MKDSGFRYMIRSASGTLGYIGRTGTTLSASLVKFENHNAALRVARRLELRTKTPHFVYVVRNAPKGEDGKRIPLPAERLIPQSGEDSLPKVVYGRRRKQNPIFSRVDEDEQDIVCDDYAESDLYD